ncbi:uncharacterized mitochondrial protein AtMg00860-like [Ziziphus jujuba]|uniref:Uncharacterized mitochondrial protein AtMg00860-like n=1 Tax=Ziziphus jujuba TaxID=326968 RepID=A0ABM3ZSL7_ZIZJJ|nr:uncharacterized mitochondrial protein AtMg00860-like [Ziziphus jujuba]
MDDFDVILGMDFLVKKKAIPTPTANSLLMMGEQMGVIPVQRKQLNNPKLLSALQFKKGKKKCAFGMRRIKFLGHIIEEGKIRIDMEKVKVIQEWKTPTNVKELRSFMGLANYDHRFVKGYLKKATPLMELLKKEVLWEWSKECEGAFDNLKEAMMKDPVLALPDITRPFEV